LRFDGTKNYQDEEAFRAAGMGFSYNDFVHTTYPRPFGPFQPRLSVIDLVFNASPESREIVLGGRCAASPSRIAGSWSGFDTFWEITHG
jgi:hypothetical protein